VTNFGVYPAVGWIGGVPPDGGTRSPEPSETFGPGKDGEIDRGDRAAPHVRDNAFVPENPNGWLSSDHVGYRQVGTARHPRAK
jgi:hypothetical protein